MVNNPQYKMHILMSGIRLLLLTLQPGKPTNLYQLTMVPPILQTHDYNKVKWTQMICNMQ